MVGNYIFPLVQLKFFDVDMAMGVGLAEGIVYPIGFLFAVNRGGR